MSNTNKNLGSALDHKESEDEDHKKTDTIVSSDNDRNIDGDLPEKDLGKSSKTCAQQLSIDVAPAANDSRSTSDYSDESDYFEQSYTDSEYFHDDTDHEEDLESEDQTIESRCLIAIGIPDDDSENERHEHQQEELEGQRSTHLTASDEAVANSIAREEHNMKMRIKRERESTGRLRRATQMRSIDATATAGASFGVVSQPGSLPSSSSFTSATRADREREEKMRTLEARRWSGRGVVSRARPLREGGSSSPAMRTASPRPPISLGRYDDRERSKVGENDKYKTETIVSDKKQIPTISNTDGAIRDGVFAQDLSPRDSQRPLLSKSTNDETTGSGGSSSGSQRSVSSGIDLDEKTRERIIARSNLRCAHPRRPFGSSRGRTNIVGAAALSTSMSRKRPSDDKRNQRISPKITPSSLIQGDSNNTQPQPAFASGNLATARVSRPSDEKAAFLRRRNPQTASMPMTHNSPSTTDTVGQFARNRDGLGPVVSLGSHVEENADGIGNNDFDLEPLETINLNHNDSEQHRRHRLLEDGLETGRIDVEEPEILPGAFAVSGIGDDEEGHGVFGYDSGFEDDANILSEVMNSDTEDFVALGGQEESQQLNNGNGDPKSTGTGSAMVDSSTTAVTSTPLRAELYEAAVTAEILIAEEDPNTPGKIRRLSVQVTCALLAVLLVAVILISVVLPEALLRKNASIDNQTINFDREQVIEGWRLVGDVLTVDDFLRDNIRFGNAVAISADGNRIAVGLPGSDNPVDNVKSTGSVQIFDLVNGTEWETKFQIFGLHSNARLGANVALSDDGKRVAIGASSKYSDETGYVSIHHEINTTRQWELIGNIAIGMNPTETSVYRVAFGFSGDGTVIAIGDKYFDVLAHEDIGVVNIYQEINGTWNQMGNSILGSKGGDLFGWSVALSKDGNRVAASSVGTTENSSNVRVFDFNRASWEVVGASLVGDSNREFFGVSLELSGDGSVVAVGATEYLGDEKANVGIVRSFRYDRGEEKWLLYGQPLEGENQFDAFGSSIALSYSGNMVAIGGPGNGNEKFYKSCGYIKVFKNTGETWNSSGFALGKSGNDCGQFGYAVALSAKGNRLVGAAPFTTFDGIYSSVGQVLVFDSNIEN